MTSREKVLRIADRKNDGGCAFWTGHPHGDTVPIYIKKAGVKDIEGVYKLLRDDCRWIWANPAYKHPDGRPMFDTSLGVQKHALAEGGYFADCEDIREVEKFPWPDVKHLDFAEVVGEINRHSRRAVFSGFWSGFFHEMCGFFGMENYFVKMYTDPAVVEAVTERLVDFYVRANELFFQAAGDSFDIFFFGNDFGTQLDLLISPENFNKFVLPGTKRIIAAAKKYGKKVMLHSCGSIYRAIPALIEAGMDILHPIQALARNMDARSLSQYKKDLAFCGGIDTQELLVNGKPDDIRREADRVKRLLGPNLIVSPSHEALLPNVPYENVKAMAEEALA